MNGSSQEKKAEKTASFLSTTADGSGNDKWYNATTLIKIAIGALVLGVVFYHVDMASVGSLLRRCDLLVFAQACLSMTAAVAVNALRWREVTRHMEPPLGTRDAMVGSFEAMFFNQLLPTNIGGDAIKTLRAIDAGANTGDAVLGVLIDRAFGLWFVAFSIAGFWAIGGSPLVETPAFRLVGIASVVILLGAIAAVGLGTIVELLPVPGWMRPLATLMRQFSRIVVTPNRIGPISIYLVIANLFTMYSFLLCCRSLGIDIGFWDSAVLLQSMVLASVIPVSVGGWGLREGAAAALATGVPISTVAAVSSAILLGMAMTVLALGGAIAWAVSPYRRIERMDAGRSRNAIGMRVTGAMIAGNAEMTDTPAGSTLSPRKLAILANAQVMAPERRKWMQRNAAYYADDRRYLRFLIPRKSNVLALGCGIGDQLAQLDPAPGVGIDMSPRMIEEARKYHPNLEFLVGDPEDSKTIDQLKSPVDYVVLIDTIGYLEDIEGTLQMLHRLCERETRLVIAYYSPGWEPFIKFATKIGWRMPQPQPNLISTVDFLNILDLAEFEPIRSEWRQIIPFKLLGLGRLINRFIGPLPGIRRFGIRNYVIARSSRAIEQRTASTTIVIPCRNEKGNIERAILEMPRFGGHQEIIFVEGNSKDGTYEECLRVQQAYAGQWDIKVLKQEGRGKGDAVRKGFAHATGDILMILDADLTVPPAALPKFYKAIASGKGEFINGTRLVYPMENEAMRLLNHIANRTFAALFSYLLNQRFTDTLCGTKVLWRRDYERIVANRSYFGDFDPFGDFDLIFGASKCNLKIVEVPVQYKARTYGETQISRFRDGWLLLRMVLYAFKKLKAV